LLGDAKAPHDDHSLVVFLILRVVGTNLTLV
jgi:hypothetical protein